jgi:predicted acylesterase/phospholipase RssA
MRFMSDTGLALSGGGFRATLFHLGVVRYLRDSGAIHHIKDIAAVSGGSILAAHLVLNWDRYSGDEASFDEAAAEIIRFVQFDLRNHIVRRLPLTYPIRLAGKFIGSDTRQLSPNALLEEYYREFLFGDRRLFELQERPGLYILTTNVSDGTLAAFNRRGLHILRRGPAAQSADPFQHVPGTTMSIAKAVGASSAFPGFFPPVRVTADDLGVNEGQFPGESFTDGGVYDNLGTRAFSWIHKIHDENYDRIIVSDAGKPFQILGHGAIGFVAQSIRATDILWDRVWQLERENFGHQNGFFFAQITDVIDRAADPHALHPVVQREVSNLRTDLDRFSDLEIAALVRHGYEVTRATHRGLADRSDVPLYEGPAWDPLPGRHALAVAASPPSPTATARSKATDPAARIAATLREGSRRRIWSTMFDLRDWPTYVYAILALLVFVWLPVRFWRIHRHAEMLTSVIDSIAEGDPDIRLVLDLVDGDPSADWRPITIEPATKRTPPQDFTGVEILSYSRIVDLREATVRQGPNARIRDRLLVRFDDEDESRRQLIFHSLLPAESIEFLQPPGQPLISIRRVPATTATAAADPAKGPAAPPDKQLEIHVDCSGVPAGEPFTIEAAILLKRNLLNEGRLPLDMITPADLLTVWMLFPEDRPYRSYRLLRYPAGDAAHPEPMTPRYSIDHPYGTLIGWSVINPRQNMVYECRWTN